VQQVDKEHTDRTLHSRKTWRSNNHGNHTAQLSVATMEIDLLIGHAAEKQAAMKSYNHHLSFSSDVKRHEMQQSMVNGIDLDIISCQVRGTPYL
jgi:hypothetical protein